MSTSTTSTPQVVTPQVVAPVPASDSKPSLGEEIYSGTASFGRFWALFGAITGTIVGIILIIIGIFILAHKDTLVKVQGIITTINGDNTKSASCPMGLNNMFSCSVTVSYTYNGQSYNQQTIYTDSESIYVGKQITVRIDPANPSVPNLSQDVPKWLGGLLIGIAILMIASGWFWYWASRKWKMVAAAEGAGGLLNIATGGRL